jgi:hypothetical protein
MAKSSQRNEGGAPSVAPTVGTSESDNNGDEDIGESRTGGGKGNVSEDMPTRKDVVMELLRCKKITITQVWGELENLTKTI